MRKSVPNTIKGRADLKIGDSIYVKTLNGSEYSGNLKTWIYHNWPLEPKNCFAMTLESDGVEIKIPFEMIRTGYLMREKRRSSGR